MGGIQWQGFQHVDRLQAFSEVYWIELVRVRFVSLPRTTALRCGRTDVCIRRDDTSTARYLLWSYNRCIGSRGSGSGVRLPFHSLGFGTFSPFTPVNKLFGISLGDSFSKELTELFSSYGVSHLVPVGSGNVLVSVLPALNWNQPACFYEFWRFLPHATLPSSGIFLQTHPKLMPLLSFLQWKTQWSFSPVLISPGCTSQDLYRPGPSSVGCHSAYTLPFPFWHRSKQ